MSMPKDFLINNIPCVFFNAFRNCNRFILSRLVNFLDELLELTALLNPSASSPQFIAGDFFD